MDLEQIVCTIEQMQDLKKLGFTTFTASMARLVLDDDDTDNIIAIHDDACYEKTAALVVPAFSISDMLEMLPETLNGDCSKNEYYFYMERCNGEYRLAYKDGYHKILYYAFDASLRDALVAELKLLKENKKI